MKIDTTDETTTQWRQIAKGLLKSEIAKRNLSYAEVAERLKAIGVETNAKVLGNKIARGAFGADFMLQVLWVIGCENLNIDNIH